MEFEKIVFAIISIAIASGVFLAIRRIIHTKFKKLKGAQKMLNAVTILIIVIELFYLGFDFDLFKFATETIASIGVAFILVGWAFQNHLKNTIAGIEVYMNPRIDIGDTIEVEGTRGTIVEMYLTKIIAITENGGELTVPTQKIHQEATTIYHKKKE